VPSEKGHQWIASAERASRVQGRHDVAGIDVAVRASPTAVGGANLM